MDLVGNWIFWIRSNADPDLDADNFTLGVLTAFQLWSCITCISAKSTGPFYLCPKEPGTRLRIKLDQGHLRVSQPK